MLIAGFTAFGFLTSRLKYVSEPLKILPGCGSAGLRSTVVVEYGLVCLSELVVVVLTTRKCVEHAEFNNLNTILFVLYRDGILFFFCLFGVSVFNIVATMHWHDEVPMLQSVAHTVLTSRVILHLHIAAAVGDDDDAYLDGSISLPVFAEGHVPSRSGGSDGLGLGLSSRSMTRTTPSMVPVLGTVPEHAA